MLSFSLVAEALTGLIYHRPSGENSKFLPCKSESHSHKGCPNKEARKPKCANCKGRLIKGVLNTKRMITYGEQAKILCRIRRPKALTQPKSPQTFQFIAEPLTKFVANVVIQIAQPQVCYPNPKRDMLDLKSSMCRKISNGGKSTLSVDITGNDLFDSIGSLSASAPSSHSCSRAQKRIQSPNLSQNHPQFKVHITT